MARTGLLVARHHDVLHLDVAVVERSAVQLGDGTDQRLEELVRELLGEGQATLAQFRVWGLGVWGFRVWDLGFGVWGLGFRV